MGTPKENSRNENIRAIEKLPEFEPGLPWYSIHNIEAARVRGLSYEPTARAYVDSDGCPVRDRFGQPLGVEV